MAFTGEEKRIQALFEEMRLDDKCIVPPFSRLVRTTTGSGSSFVRPWINLRLVGFAATVVVLLCLLTARTFQYFRPRSNDGPAKAAVRQNISDPPIADNRRNNNSPKSALSVRKLRIGPSIKSRSARSRLPLHNSLSQWRSPTMSLLLMPGNQVFGSVKQLDRSADEMKTFLTMSN